MNELKSTDPNNEEVDLGQLFNAIGKLFEKLFTFLGKVLKGFFEVIIYSLKPIVNNFKLICIVIFAAAIAGFVLEQFKKPEYKSDMLVRPYFGSKYQLSNNVSYFNALIGEGNLSELSRIFEIDSNSAESLVGFNMEIGPETPNDLLVEYDSYIKSIDSTLAREVTYEQFVENRDILNANIFSITAVAKKPDIFVGLENGFRKTFENDYSKKLRERRDDTIKLRKISLQKQLEEIKTLQEVYVKLIENEANNPEVSIGAEGMFPLQQTKRETKEFDLLQRELQIRSAINRLEEKLIKENTYFDIVSGFELVGTQTSSIYNKYALVFPLLAFALMTVVFVFIKTFEFIKKYES